MNSYFEEVVGRLCAIPEKKPCCRRALLLGMFSCGMIRSGVLQATFRHSASVDLAARLCHEVYGRGCEIYFEPGGSRSVFLDSKKAAHSLGDIWNGIDSSGILICEACGSAFLRGVFLASGHMSSPEKNDCRLELTPGDSSFVYELRDFLTQREITPCVSTRRGKPYLYIKENNRLQDFLAFIGDTEGVYELVNGKFIREARENANRISNCEANNIRRSIGASQKHLDAIRLLMAAGRMASLSPELQLTAKLRIENPELSLQALCDLHDPPVSKGGLNHRLQKLIELSAGLEAEDSSCTGE